MADTQLPPQPNDTATTTTNEAVPPPSKERLGTRCCYCLFLTLWVFLVLIIIIIMLVILVLYIIFTPRSFRFTVNYARLTQFEFTTANNTLGYNLFINITAQNPNKRQKIYYDSVRAHALYQRVEFSAANVNMPWNGYLQDKKATNHFTAVFAGQNVTALNTNQVSEFREDNKDGVFPIDVNIHIRHRFRIDDFIYGDFHAKVTCELDVHLGSATAFDPTKCEVNY